MKKIINGRIKKGKAEQRRMRKKSPSEALSILNMRISASTPPGWGHFLFLFPLDGGNGKYGHSSNVNPKGLAELLRGIADKLESQVDEQEKES